MKTKKIIFSLICVCLSITFCFGCANKKVEQKTANIVGFGDSISAGYTPDTSNDETMLNNYNSYVDGTTSINANCYTKLIADKLTETYDQVNVLSKAKSGDKTGDLVTLLSTDTAKEKLETATIITLCIGANNVLGPALDYMLDYIFGSKTLDQMKALFATGVSNFKSDYTNTIIPALTENGAKVYVMTIYNPYKYFSTDDIQNNLTGDDKNTVDNMFASFNTLLPAAMEYLGQINTYIKENTSENVISVDVESAFSAISKTDYSTYVNVDSSKIVINSSYDVMQLSSNLYVDPHPTSLGQAEIAKVFENQMISSD